MTIDISHILKLSAIGMDEDEIKLLQPQLENIVGWLESIAKVDTTGVEPMYNRLQDLGLSCLQDESTDKVDSADILRNAPETYDTFIVVPKVIDV